MPEAAAGNRSALRLRSNALLRRALGQVGTSFLEYCLAGLTRILPHVEVLKWSVKKGPATSRATFASADKRQLTLVLALDLGGHKWVVRATLQRRMAPAGHVGAIPRTIDLRERDLADRVLKLLSEVLGTHDPKGASSLLALKSTFDERVVSQHLTAHHGLALDLSQLFTSLRTLAEQTYENKAVVFGCVIDSDDKAQPQYGALFPVDFLSRKRFRALSDGYRSAYLVSGAGRVIKFMVSASETTKPKHRYYPEWCENIASEATGKRVAICLTRQGDILVLD